MNLVTLPELVLEKIFSFLCYDNIAQNRVVCTKFNIIGSQMLNKGYYAADRFHGKTLKAIKAKLPRRESERRIHPLARQCDILIAIETRLSMLAMTFTKWMDAKLCCFIPGKVIDEIMRVLRCVANNPNPPRAHEILQELRDISSMAMEHFDEKILPTLKMSMGVPPFLQTGSSRADEELTLLPKQRLCVFPLHPPSNAVSVSEFNKLVVRESINRKKIKAQSELLTKQTNEISELRKHVEEWEAKLRDLTANLIKAKDLPGNSSAIVSTRQRKRKSEDQRIISCKKLKKTDYSKKRTSRKSDLEKDLVNIIQEECQQKIEEHNHKEDMKKGRESMSDIHDEEIAVENSDEVDSFNTRSPRREYVASRMEMRAEMKPKRDRPMSAAKSRAPSGIQAVERTTGFIRGDTESSENSEEDDEDEGDPQEVIIEGAYDPKDYQRLPVSPEIKELFEYISFYTPVTVQLDFKLVPFIPSYIPAVGDIDGFIKVKRPDNIEDSLGLTVVDEPSIHQSEPAVMHLQLRATTKQSSAKPVVVKKLQSAEKNPKAIEKWIRDISELHKSKPPPTLDYSRPMPDIDGLMQEWPVELENKLNEIGLPLEDLDVDILTYADIICAIFDIPRYESRIESLHVLFTLYSAIKNYKSNDEEDAVLESQEN